MKKHNSMDSNYNKEDFQDLIEKYLDGKISLEEVKLLVNYYHSFKLENDWVEELGNEEPIKQRMLINILEAIEDEEYKESKVIRLFNSNIWQRVAVAASIVLLLGTGIFYFTKPKQEIIQVAQEPLEIAPGGSRGILTLSNGKQIILADISSKDTIAKEGKKEEVTIKMNAKGVITYIVNPHAGPSKEDSNAFNTLSTPIGGQYNIVLADGTKVYLNAVSSIKYPTQFNGGQRMVELEGEAYFEVAKNKNKPFIVKSGDQDIEVLGTHFNVHAYKDEPVIKTTLLEGSVAVSYKDQKTVLKPGQQSNVTLNFNKIKVRYVDAEGVVAWKDGHFQFDNADLKTVMKQLERWYGIKTEYRGDFSDLRFDGATYMNKNLSEVLKVLELSNNIKFKVEGKTIIVYP